MRIFNALLVVFGCSSCMLSCEASTNVSYKSDDLLIASGVRPSVVLENHEALEGLASKKLDGSLAGTDSGRQMLTLLVACALGSQDVLTVTVEGSPLEFFGEAGLAPEWATKGLNRASKGWISACVLTHLSANGLPVVISIRGHKAVLRAPSDERAEWPREEGAFFGELFASGPIQWFACRGHDAVPVGLDRDCAKQDPAHPEMTLCGLTFAGDCDDVCRWDNRVCRTTDIAFREVITVRLQR